MTSSAWNRDQIVDLLTDLGLKFDQRGIRGDLFVVGGAAMALAFNTPMPGPCSICQDFGSAFRPLATCSP